MTVDHTDAIDVHVGIIGGGVAGLTLATFLQKLGITCVVLERRDREYVSQRQRAGVVEARGVRMFERWGLADELLGGPAAYTIDYRVNGRGRVFEVVPDEGTPGRFCTQQVLVNNLLHQLIDVMGGDVRFDVTEIRIENTKDRRPSIRFSDPHGGHDVSCDYLVGCDGDRGVSRSSIPSDALTTHTYEFGYAWLAALTESPAPEHSIMAVSDYGFVAQIPRGPQRSRFYLQCALSDGPNDWPDHRVWDEIRLRLFDDELENATVIDKMFVPLRSVVRTPMRHHSLFLAGDAAHIVPPASAKGMNLALCDVDTLGQALREAFTSSDTSGLDSYSDTCLHRVWKYQDFGAWMSDTMHDAGDPTQHGTFRQMTARARLDNIFESSTAHHLHSEYQQGLF